VSGRVLDSTSVDFDAFLDGGARRHLGMAARDTISGSWVEPTSGGVASGSFQGVKAP